MFRSSLSVEVESRGKDTVELTRIDAPEALEEETIDASETDLFIPKPESTSYSFCEGVYAFCNKLKDRAYKIADFQPELNYTIGVAAQFFTRPFLQNLPTAWPRPELSSLACDSITIGWNYLDGLCGLVSAVRLLANKEDYHKNQNRIKATLNIFSSLEMFLLTYQPFISSAGWTTNFAGAAFAIAMLTDAVSLSTDVAVAAKKSDFLGWLDEALLELDHYNKLLNDSSDDEEMQDNILKKIAELKRNIEVRCRVNYFKGEAFDTEEDYDLLDESAKTSQKFEETELRSSMGARMKKIESVFLQHESLINQINMMGCFHSPSEEDKTTNKSLQFNCDEELRVTCLNFIYKVVSVSGMSLLALSTQYASLFNPGLMLVSSVGGFYLVKHSASLINMLKTINAPDTKISVKGLFSRNTTEQPEPIYVDISTIKLSTP